MGIPFVLVLMVVLGAILVTAYTLAPGSIKQSINQFFELEGTE